MFSYFGSKSKLIDKYPRPKHSFIMEPFAGSARYACKYGLDRGVWINDSYDVVYRIWNYIQSCTKSDILSLPNLVKGDDLRDIKTLSDVEREFLGFCVGQCRNNPGNVLTGWAARDDEINRTKRRILHLVGNIGHWKITNLDFRSCRVGFDATYFIDPPYQNRKSDYIIATGRNFYQQCRRYVLSDTVGQRIVCEGDDADWLNFEPLTKMTGQRRPSNEMVFIATS